MSTHYAREELNWVFYKADTTTGRRNYGIDPGEVAYAVRVWKGYLDNKVYLDQTFEKYDPENTGRGVPHFHVHTTRVGKPSFFI